MRYYYFNPFSKQYYFPENFKKYSLFLSFYHPYTFFGHLLWFLWRKSGVWRKFFSENKLDLRLPIECIKNHVPSGSILAFNRGTPGPERKITSLGIDPISGEKFFIKYAESSITKNNVGNEANILTQLNHVTIVPKLQLYISQKEYSLIKTNLIEGKRFSNKPINEELLGILLQIAKQSIKTRNNYPTELKVLFAHGDFCPWNMMVSNNRIMLFDWEMAGTFPAGYDLFTYIFQTSFLLTPKISFENLLELNQEVLKYYFNAFSIDDWRPYLIEFAKIKVKSESEKKKLGLLKPYFELALHAKKI